MKFAGLRLIGSRLRRAAFRNTVSDRVEFARQFRTRFVESIWPAMIRRRQAAKARSHATQIACDITDAHRVFTGKTSAFFSWCRNTTEALGT